MNFGPIVSRSLQIAWRYKSLWIFGLFSGYCSDFNVNIGLDPEQLFRLSDDAQLEHLAHLLGPLLLAVGILALVFFIIHCIAVPALIDGVNRIARGGVYRFDVSFSRGIDFFFRYLGLILLALIVFVGAGVVLTLIALTIVGLLIAIPAGLFGVFAFVSVFALTERALVVRDCSIGEAISEGYYLFRKNMSNCLIMLLLVIGLAIVIGIVVIIAGLIAYWPVNSFIHAFADSRMSVLLLGVLLGLPVALVLSGFTGTFFTTLYTLFYFELVEPAPTAVATGPAPGTGEVAGPENTPPSSA